MSMANLGGGDIGSSTRTLCHPGVTGNFLSSGVVPNKDPSINTLAPSRLHDSLRKVYRLDKSGGKRLISLALGKRLFSRLIWVVIGA